MIQSLQQGVNFDDRVAYLTRLREEAAESVRRVYDDRLLMSWIYHDSALEGVVYTMEELRAAIAGQSPPDASLVPTFDEIRSHKLAIDIVREYADKKRVAITLDTVKRIYGALAPDEVEGKGPPKYRKDMPVHRLYFHDIATPDKIQPQMKQLLDWMNSPETKRSTHAVRLAAKAHFQMLHIYPFPKHTGKVARLLMNLVLLRHDFPPVVIHAAERQRYYEALKNNDNQVAQLVNEALVASVESGIRDFEEALGITV